MRTHHPSITSTLALILSFLHLTNADSGSNRSFTLNDDNETPKSGLPAGAIAAIVVVVFLAVIALIALLGCTHTKPMRSWRQKLLRQQPKTDAERQDVESDVDSDTEEDIKKDINV